MPKMPNSPKIYHILHIDRMQSILNEGGLFSDFEIQNKHVLGSNIGMQHIKDRRLRASLSTYPDLTVGQCVPFYFCPRSVMLYSINQGSQYLTYQGGQGPIVHLEFDLYKVIEWANQNAKRWAFTNINAGASFFDDYNQVSDLNKLDWNAIEAKYWADKKDMKQAEFLIEKFIPIELVEQIGVHNQPILRAVQNITRMPAKIQSMWYY